MKTKSLSLPQKILIAVKGKKEFNTKFLYQSFSDEVKTTVRGRLYGLLDRELIERIGDDTYRITANGKELVKELK